MGTAITVIYFLGIFPMAWYFFRHRANHAFLSALFWPYVGGFLLVVALISRPDLRRKVGMGAGSPRLPHVPPGPAAQAPTTTIQRPKYGIIESAERDDSGG
jgi:hypothetical protein